MSHTKHSGSHSEDGAKDSGGNDPYWKTAHHDWKFWIAVMLMLAAMGGYIMTLDFAVRPDVPNASPAQTTP